MRQYKIIITPTAENDLQEIYKYIAADLSEPQIAINQCARIEQGIFKLNTMPNRHTLYKKEPWFSRGLRVFPIEKFLVFFITNESDSTVYILRIMYSGRNLEEQL